MRSQLTDKITSSTAAASGSPRAEARRVSGGTTGTGSEVATLVSARAGRNREAGVAMPKDWCGRSWL
jgi:hypothetical protein